LPGHSKQSGRVLRGPVAGAANEKSPREGVQTNWRYGPKGRMEGWGVMNLGE